MKNILLNPKKSYEWTGSIHNNSGEVYRGKVRYALGTGPQEQKRVLSQEEQDILRAGTIQVSYLREFDGSWRTSGSLLDQFLSDWVEWMMADENRTAKDLSPELFKIQLNQNARESLERCLKDGSIDVDWPRV